MRTGCSVLVTVLPERGGHPASEARDIADQLMASFGSMLLYWWHFTRNGRRIDVETDDDSIAAPFLHLLRSEEHTSELQSLMRISYAVFYLKKKILIYYLTHILIQTTQ